MSCIKYSFYFIEYHLVFINYWIEDHIWNNTKRMPLVIFFIGMFFMLIGPFFFLAFPKFCALPFLIICATVIWIGNK
jgi:uncharacterized membrane protein